MPLNLFLTCYKSFLLSILKKNPLCSYTDKRPFLINFGKNFVSSSSLLIEYLIKSTKTDEILYNRTGLLRLSSSSNSGNIFVDLAVSMIKTAFTKEVNVAHKCNEYTFTDIPKGKYSPLHGKDQESKAGDKEFTVTLTQ